MPRNKMLHRGTSSLTDSDLLYMLLNAGSKEQSARAMAKDIMHLVKGNLHELGKLSLSDLRKIKGMGSAKATMLAAAIELGRRRHSSQPLEKIAISNSREIASYLKVQLQDFGYEVFAVIFLNRANRIKHFEIISRGGITGTVADPRLILKKAVEKEATSIILTHNHPSGNLKPSMADEEITTKIKNAASYLDIKVLDHIIVSEDGYFSFADEGLI